MNHKLMNKWIHEGSYPIIVLKISLAKISMTNAYALLCFSERKKG